MIKSKSTDMFTKSDENTKMFREMRQKTKTLFCKYTKLQRSEFYDKINVQSEN